MTGAIVLGGITSMDQARRKAELTETESEPGAQAQLCLLYTSDRSCG